MPGLVTTDPRIERLKELQAQQIELLKKKNHYVSTNRMEFFGKGVAIEGRKLEFNPLQADLIEGFTDWAYKIFTFTGANRIGKTYILTVLAFSMMFGKYLWDNTKLYYPHKNPRKVRYIGQDWEKHIQTVVIPTMKLLWPQSRKLHTKKNNIGIEAVWTDVKTGSTLEIMSNKQESDLHEGWMGDGIFYDEPPKREIRVANSRGLVDRQGRETFAMTLLKEAWVDREVIKARNPDGTPDTTVFNVTGSIEVNVGYGITQEGVDQFAKTLTEDEKEARLRGVPSYLSTLVFPKFNRKTHLRKRLKEIPLDWIIDIHIDFHPTKPWAVLFWATDSRNFRYCIDEIFEKGSWKAIGEEVIRRIKKQNLRVGQILIDPLAKGDAQSDLHEETVYDKLGNLFAGYGYSLRGASKDKDGGINLVDDLLMTENELPALFFFDNLSRTIYEIEGWMKDEDGKPMKKDDDMMEGLYRLALLDTQYFPPEEKEEDIRSHKTTSTANAWTGY